VGARTAPLPPHPHLPPPRGEGVYTYPCHPLVGEGQDGGKGDTAVTDKTYQRIFLVGALWNLLGAGLFFLFWRQAFTFFQLAHPNYLAFFQAWLALAFVFGIGYYYVYRDLYGNLNIVRLGIYGKTGFALIFIYHVIFSGFHPVFLSGAIIDLMFVILYARFLVYARSRSA
jgi:hypothetical protein